MSYIGWLGWTLFIVMVLWHLSKGEFHYQKRINLTSYIVMILLRDETHADHQEKFRDWIRAEPASDAMQLSVQAGLVVESIADQLAGTSILGAHSML